MTMADVPQDGLLPYCYIKKCMDSTQLTLYLHLTSSGREERRSSRLQLSADYSRERRKEALTESFDTYSL